MQRSMILVFAVLAVWSTHTSGQTAMKIDKVLTEQMAASRDTAERFPVIVTLNKTEDRARIQERGIELKLLSESIAAFSAQLTAAEIAVLDNQPDVRLIEADQKAHAIGIPR
jgi:hypothetical protein